MIALFVLILFSIIGFSLLVTSNNTNKMTDHERMDQAVFYIAESGLTQTVSALNQLVKSAYDEALAIYNSKSGSEKKIDVLTKAFNTSIEQTINSFNDHKYTNYEAYFKYNPSSIITINEIKSNKAIGYYEFEIISSGSIDKKERKVSQTIIINLGLEENDNPDNGNGPKLIITPGNSVMTDSKKIEVQVSMQGGPSGNQIPKDKFIEFDATEYSNLKSLYDNLLQSCKAAYPSINEQISNPSSNSVIALTKNTKISNYNGKKMIFDIGDRNITIQLEYENLNNETSITVKGTGKLRIIGKIGNFNSLLEISKENTSATIEFVGDNINYNGNSNLQLDGNFCLPNSGVTFNKMFNIKGYMIAYGSNFHINGSGRLNVNTLLAPYTSVSMDNSLTISQNSIVGGLKLNGSGSINAGAGSPTNPSLPPPNKLFTKKSLFEVD